MFCLKRGTKPVLHSSSAAWNLKTLLRSFFSFGSLRARRLGGFGKKQNTKATLLCLRKWILPNHCFFVEARWAVRDCTHKISHKCEYCLELVKGEVTHSFCYSLTPSNVLPLSSSQVPEAVFLPNNYPPNQFIGMSFCRLSPHSDFFWKWTSLKA